MEIFHDKLKSTSTNMQTGDKLSYVGWQGMSGAQTLRLKSGANNYSITIYYINQDGRKNSQGKIRKYSIYSFHFGAPEGPSVSRNVPFIASLKLQSIIERLFLRFRFNHGLHFESTPHDWGGNIANFDEMRKLGHAEQRKIVLRSQWTGEII